MLIDRRFLEEESNVIHHRNVLGAYRKADFRTAAVTATYSTMSDSIGLWAGSASS